MLVGVDVAAAGAPFDAHVADGHPLVHRHAVEDFARVFVGEADAAVDAQAADDVQDHVLGVDAGPQAAVDLDAADFGPAEGQRLRGQHVGDLAGADAERDVAEGPCVLVWLSPQASVMPGCVRPSSGPTTCTMPWRASARSSRRMPNSRQLRSMADIISSARPSAKGRAWLSVGTMWSTVASVRSGYMTLRRRSRSMAKACGTGDFVDQVLADEELRLPRRQFAHRVRVPDFVEQISPVGHVSVSPVSSYFSRTECGARGGSREEGSGQEGKGQK